MARALPADPQAAVPAICQALDASRATVYSRVKETAG
jgi:hypothetical protein